MTPPPFAFLVYVLNFSSALVVPAAANFAHLQGVSNSYYGSPLCVLIIDCGAANEGTLPSLPFFLFLLRQTPWRVIPEYITAEVTNVNRNETVMFNLEALCSQDGLFFGTLFVLQQ